MKKVAFVTTGAFPVPAVRGGAAEALVEELLQTNEKEQKVELTVVSIADEKAREIGAELYPSVHFEFVKPAGFFVGLDACIHFFAYRVLHLSSHLAYKTMFQRLNYIRKVGRYLHENSFDRVVYENQMALLWTLKYKNNAEKYKGKYYFHLHNHPARYAGNEALAGQCAKILTVSSFIGHAFAKNIDVLYSEDKFFVLKNRVDEKIFDPASVTREDVTAVKKKLGVENKQVILFLGRLIPGKGVAELLEAYKSMDHTHTLLVIVGSFNFNNSEHSPYESVLNKLIQEIGEEHVRFTGYVDHNEVPKYYAAADLVILPSTCEDAAPLAVIETMMMHRPLITTTMGGIPEYADPSCAVLLKNDEMLVKNLRSEAERLLKDEETRAQMSRNAEEVTRNWTLSSFYASFLEGLNLN